MTDVPASTSTTASISVGGTIQGALEVAGDHDWYRISLTAGQQVTISLSGTPGPGGVSDTYLNLRSSTGAIITYNDDSGGTLNSKIVFTAPTTGTYYIDAGAWDTTSNPPARTNTITGNYTLSVQPYTPPPVWTYDQIADQLVNGYWNSQGQSARHFAVSPGGNITVNYSTLTPAEQALAIAALGEWSDIIGVTFTPVTTGGQIQFNDTNPTTGGPVASTSDHTSGGLIISADIHISQSWVNSYGTGLNSYSFQSYLHEIGHALGLGHAGDYNNTADYVQDALYANDSWSTTIMSYFDQHDNAYFANQGFSQEFVLTPMIADIVAMQQIYGASTTTRVGNTTYGFNSNTGNSVYNATYMQGVTPSGTSFPGYTIVDSGGVDTLDYSGFSQAQVINLNPETFSNIGGDVGNVSIGRGTIIENAIGGSGNDTIIGNDVANVLTGNAGNDTLNGGLGDDFLIGGSGADTLTGGGGNDTFRDTFAGLGGDTITDFGAGDKIVITDASLSNFAFNVSGTTLTINGSTVVHLGAAPSGTLVATAAAGGGVQLAMAQQQQFGAGLLKLADFGSSVPAGSWTSDNQTPRMLADLNGDGMADIIGFGSDGVHVALANANGTFTDKGLVLSQFGGSIAAGGWSSQDQYERVVADVNGDGRGDIVAFGQSAVYVSLGNGDGTFGAATVATTQFTSSIGWASDNHYPRELADVNGDGRDDIVGFGENGVYVALANANGTFATATLPLQMFGAGPSAGSWASNDQYARMLADVNGDGRADIVAFGQNAVYVALAGANGSFAMPTVATTQFTGALGWSQNHDPREIADVNGDGIVDIVGFGDSGVYVALGNGNGTFQNAFLDTAQFGAGTTAGGWSSEDAVPRHLADINQDGAAYIVGFGSGGVYVAYSNGDIF